MSLIEVTPFASLAEAQAHARKAVDEVAEETRGRFITPGGGQALEYQSAVEEARREKAGEAGPFPMLQADVDAGMAVDIDGAADLVLSTRSGWEAIGSAIRSIRLGGKRQIDLATTQSGVAQVRVTAIAQLRALGT